uniref:Uncharacterized protein n=1 Tax=Anguilla anguilla TaxID=7936 RepID=A0A0E9VZY1_ANGAN
MQGFSGNCDVIFTAGLVHSVNPASLVKTFLR